MAGEDAGAETTAEQTGSAVRGLLTVRPIEPEDLDALVTLMAERAAFYAAFDGKPPQDADAISQRLLDSLFSARPLGEALIARRGAEPAGVLFFGELFPGADLRRAIFVKEIFVSAAARRSGVGRALLARMRRIARGRDADRVELHVHPDNVGAEEFYAREGLKRMDRQVYRVDL